MTQPKPKIILGQQWAKELCRALSIDGARVARLVIDCQPGQLIRIHVEYYGDERLLHVSPPDPQSVEIVSTRTIPSEE